MDIIGQTLKTIFLEQCHSQNDLEDIVNMYKMYVDLMNFWKKNFLSLYMK